MTATLHLRLGAPSWPMLELYEATSALAGAHGAQTSATAVQNFGQPAPLDVANWHHSPVYAIAYIDRAACDAWLGCTNVQLPPCPHCAGWGRWGDDHPCNTCGGTGSAA